MIGSIRIKVGKSRLRLHDSTRRVLTTFIDTDRQICLQVLTSCSRF